MKFTWRFLPRGRGVIWPPMIWGPYMFFRIFCPFIFVATQQKSIDIFVQLFFLKINTERSITWLFGCLNHWSQVFCPQWFLSGWCNAYIIILMIWKEWIWYLASWVFYQKSLWHLLDISLFDRNADHTNQKVIPLVVVDHLVFTVKSRKELHWIFI